MKRQVVKRECVLRNSFFVVFLCLFASTALALSCFAEIELINKEAERVEYSSRALGSKQSLSNKSHSRYLLTFAAAVSEANLELFSFVFAAVQQNLEAFIFLTLAILPAPRGPPATA